MKHSNFSRTVVCLLALSAAALLAGCDSEDASTAAPTQTLSQAALTVAGRTIENLGGTQGARSVTDNVPAGSPLASAVKSSAPAVTGKANSAANDTVTLSWNPPTENTDGSALTDLSGYRIAYGTSPGHYSNVVTVPNPGVASYVIENLSAGATYYFAVAAVASDGVASAYSPEASTTI